MLYYPLFSEPLTEDGVAFDAGSQCTMQAGGQFRSTAVVDADSLKYSFGVNATESEDDHRDLSTEEVVEITFGVIVFMLLVLGALSQTVRHNDACAVCCYTCLRIMRCLLVCLRGHRRVYVFY